jgi:hypothetical protein
MEPYFRQDEKAETPRRARGQDQAEKEGKMDQDSRGRSPPGCDANGMGERMPRHDEPPDDG